MKNIQKIAQHFYSYSFVELISLGAAATFVRFLFIGFSNSLINHSWMLSFIIVLLVGAVEGMGIAIIQSKPLRAMDSNFNSIIWIGTSMIGSMAGWFLILRPAIAFISVLSGLHLLSDFAVVVQVGLSGLLFGGVVGLAQYLAIRKLYHNSVVSIISKSMEWMLLSLVLITGLLVFKEVQFIVFKVAAIVGTCMLSGLIQIIMTNSIFDSMTDMRIPQRKGASGIVVQA